MDGRPMGQKSAKDLLAEAMACVAWDGVVDTDRLASTEFAHDEAATRRIVDLATISIDSPTRSGGPRNNYITVGGTALVEGAMALGSVEMHRRGAVWRITALGESAPLTDDRLALYCALCARHPRFSVSWNLTTGNAGSTNGSRYHLEWKDMWMSRIVRALAAASGAWTGDEVMRTQRLARALLNALRVRSAEGPLGKGDAKRAPGGSADGAVSERLREAIAIAVSMPKGVHFLPVGSPYITSNLAYDASSTTELLAFMVDATQRLYETQPFYTAVIAPAEYEALCRNTPTGAFE